MIGGTDSAAPHPHRINGSRTRAELNEIRWAIGRLFEEAQAYQLRGNPTDAEKAFKLYQQILELDPSNADAIHFIGMNFLQYGHTAEDVLRAKQAMEESIRLNPKCLQYHCNYGRVLETMGDVEGAANEYLLGIRGMRMKDKDERQSYGHVCMNLGVVRMKQGRFAEGIGWFEKSLDIKPGWRDALWNIGHARFLMGDMRAGWKGYEYRFGREAAFVRQPVLRHPRWTGDALNGRRLFLRWEQGIGDMIWHAGLFESLPKDGEITYECAPKLLRLFERSFPWMRFVPWGTVIDCDVEIPAGSVAQYFRKSLADFPKREATNGGYLRPDRDRIAHWRHRFREWAPAALAVGICWRSADVSGERALFCTTLDEWAPILKVPGVRFVSLQYDECEAEIHAVEEPGCAEIGRIPEVDMFNDLDETAALIAGLDLVISVGTSVAIMAGALGVPTWMLCYGDDWQTMGEPRSPWYPSKVHYTRPVSETWEPTIKRIAFDLTNLPKNYWEIPRA